MSERNWNELIAAQQAKGLFVCVGLDTDPGKIPAHVTGGIIELEEGVPYVAGRQLYYNVQIINATKHVAGFYKLNLAFYRGEEGKEVLRQTIAYINRVAPEIPVILDAKYGDIDNTNDGYVWEVGEFYGADAVTVHAYMGKEAMRPFLDQANKGVIVLCKTSNSGSAEFQSLMVRVLVDPETGELVTPPAEFTGSGFERHVPVYQVVANNVARHWNYNGNCAVVVGATYADDELAAVRAIIGDMPILLPGIGAQGGDLEATVSNGRNSEGAGIIVNSSRGSIFASDGEDYAQRAGEEAEGLDHAIDNVPVAA